MTNGRMEDQFMIAGLSSQLAGARIARNAGSRLQIATRIFDTLLLWQARGRQRRTLAGFNDHMLRDIGRSREEAARECAKPMWHA
jgi:uncharacterized protein YjiS (DUF1127 family)